MLNLQRSNASLNHLYPTAPGKWCSQLLSSDIAGNINLMRVITMSIGHWQRLIAARQVTNIEDVDMTDHYDISNISTVVNAASTLQTPLSRPSS